MTTNVSPESHCTVQSNVRNVDRIFTCQNSQEIIPRNSNLKLFSIDSSFIEGEYRFPLPSIKVSIVKNLISQYVLSQGEERRGSHFIILI